MVLRTSGLRRRILRAVNAQWGVLKQDHRVLRSQYNLSQVQLDRYLRDYNNPTNVQASAWEDKVEYYRGVMEEGVKPAKKDHLAVDKEYQGYEFVESEVVKPLKRHSWHQDLKTTKGDMKWIVRYLSKTKPVDVGAICEDLLKRLCIDMNQFKRGFKYNKHELTRRQLDECCATIAACEILKQYPLTDSDWTKLDMVESILNDQITEHKLIREEKDATSVDHLLELVTILKIRKEPDRALEYLEVNPANLKMMNAMVSMNPDRVLDIMNRNEMTPNFETFGQLLQVSDERRTVDLIQYILKKRIVCRPLWMDMLRAAIRTKNEPLVEAMFSYSMRCFQNGVTSIANYEIYDQLAQRYAVKGIDHICLDSTMCATVYAMHEKNNNGDAMVRVVAEWERVNK